MLLIEASPVIDRTYLGGQTAISTGSSSIMWGPLHSQNSKRNSTSTSLHDRRSRCPFQLFEFISYVSNNSPVTRSAWATTFMSPPSPGDGASSQLRDARRSRFTYRQLAQLATYSITTPLRVIAHVDLDAFYAQCEMIRLGVAEDTPLAVQQW